MQSNSNVTKFSKTSRFSFDEAQDRIGKGRKLNKTKKQSKRDQWADEE